MKCPTGTCFVNENCFQSHWCLFGKNPSFEQFLINRLQFFISDNVITHAFSNFSFIKEPKLNLYSVLICFLGMQFEGKNSIYFHPNFRSLILQNKKYEHDKFFCHSNFMKLNYCRPTFPVSSYWLSLHLCACSFLFSGVCSSLGVMQTAMTIFSVLLRVLSLQPIFYWGSKTMCFWRHWLTPFRLNCLLHRSN